LSPGKYEANAEDTPKGVEYQEFCDVAKANATQEHYDMYQKDKDKVAKPGVEFPF
jgi:hypothetical protein